MSCMNHLWVWACYATTSRAINKYLSSSLCLPVSNDSYSKIHELLLKLFSPSEQRNPILDLLSPPTNLPQLFFTPSILPASSLMLSFVEANLRFWPCSLLLARVSGPISPAVLISFDASTSVSTFYHQQARTYYVASCRHDECWRVAPQR